MKSVGPGLNKRSFNVVKLESTVNPTDEDSKLLGNAPFAMVTMLGIGDVAEESSFFAQPKTPAVKDKDSNKQKLFFIFSLSLETKIQVDFLYF